MPIKRRGTASGRTKSFRDLLVWQSAMSLMYECYRLAARLPRHELFGMASQLRRAALSVPANIAEGNGRIHRGEYVHHLSIARGSLQELMTLLYAAEGLEYLSGVALSSAHEKADETSRMLYRMIDMLRE